MTERYKIAGPDIVHEDFGGDLVVLNLASGQYFGLNSAAALVWTALLDGHDPAKIDTDQANSTTVADFVAKLQGFGLIVPDVDNAAPVTPANLSLPDAPTIEAYEDLADLIVADPIHDVDADMGWPKQPESS